MARHINFGLWYDFRNPAPQVLPPERFYHALLDQIAESENLGFDSVWLTEHHFTDDGYTPSPLVIAGAIGGRTTRLRMGTNLMILPLHDPIRIAEDAATLSLLTGGRFDLGVGGGYRQVEFDQFNRQLSHRPSLLEEAMEIIRAAWSGERVAFQGKRFTVNDLPISPAPQQAPRLLLGGMALPAIERAAKLADGFLSTGGIGHDVYVAAAETAGRADDAAIFAGHWAIVSPDPKAEARRVGPYVLNQANTYIKWGAFGPPEETPLFPDGDAAIAGGLYELWDADQAVAELTKLLTDWPQIRDIHFWARFPGEPMDQGWARVQYLAENVIPKVRRAVAS